MRHIEETLRRYHHFLPNHIRVTATAFFFLTLSWVVHAVSPHEIRPFHVEHELRIASYVKEHKEKQRVLTARSEKKGTLEQVAFITIGEQKLEPTTVPVISQAWGKSEQVDEHTWTIRVQDDARNATADEILQALNAYRKKYGIGVLQKDDALTAYAQSRSDFFDREKKLDSHAGFQDFIKHQDGFGKVGFNALGENSSYGFTLEGVHLIEWVYAGDKPHDDNQKNPQWTHVGIGVTGKATNLIFAGKKR